MAATSPSPSQVDAVLSAGDRLLAALNADDFDTVLETARRRGALVAALVRSDAPPDPADAARFVEQDHALAHHLGLAHNRLAEALRQSGRVQHAADRYGSAPPRLARLQASG